MFEDRDIDFQAWERGRRRRQERRFASRTVNARAAVLGLAFMIAFVVTNHCHLSLLSCPGVVALTLAQRRAMVVSRVKRGLILSQDAKHNITAAEEACELWETVLSRISSSSFSSPIITNDVLSLSKTLYASCLVRVGRDAEAVSVYDSCLDDPDFHKTKDVISWRLSKARCLQRLLRYSDAAEAFLKVAADAAESTNSDNDNSGDYFSEEQQTARLGAAICILRSTGDVAYAREILVKDDSRTAVSGKNPDDILLLSSCLEYLETGDGNRTVSQLQEILSSNDNSVKASLDNVSASKPSLFILYRWILDTLKRIHSLDKDTSMYPPVSMGMNVTNALSFDANDLFMELIRINTSPLDDPGLLQLDDKIELHRLLRAIATDSPTTSYWPEGFALPAQTSEVKKLPIGPNEDSQLWISKSRAGYGSHGNRILSLAEAREEILCQNSETEPYLLQRMIDPLLLLKGYKFSLRIYVICFTSDEAYISSKGLVKLASAPLLTDTDAGDSQQSFRDPSMHMTNSGRESVMQQEGLEYLWNALDGRETLWKDICSVAADVVLHRCSNADSLPASFPERNQEWKDRREALGIPKILGLDFVVDATHRKPWLVEVNRFPGLEPRDEEDRKIKHRVVADAWKKAAERLEILDEERRDGRGATIFDATILDALCGDEGADTKSSLERLRL